MNNSRTSNSFYIGWDVGGWNCDKNQRSRDAIVILDAKLSLVGKPWRGNLRDTINKSAGSRDFICELFALCEDDPHINPAHVTLAIDTPLGFSDEFVRLVTELKCVGAVENSNTNPYLYRQTERYLFEMGLKPLSPVKDMIGSQATKGMHVLAKFAPKVEHCGVWSDGELLTAIEAYPSSCKHSETIKALRQKVAIQTGLHPDERDALTCALVAYLFTEKPDELIAPGNRTPVSEGWIWVPKDID